MLGTEIDVIGVPSHRAQATDDSRTAGHLTRKRSLLWLLLIVSAASVVRLVELGRQSFYWDESLHGMSAMMLLQYGVSPWGTLGQPPVYTYATSIWVHLIGASEFAVRLMPAIAGTLQLPVAYALGTMWYGRITGLVSALLLAIIPVHVLYSRAAFSDGLECLFLLCAVLCLDLSARKRPRATLLALIALSGFLAALSFLTKLNAAALQGLYLTGLLFTRRHSGRLVLGHLASFACSILILSFGHYRGLIHLFLFWSKRAELDGARGVIGSLLDRLATSSVYWSKVLYLGLSPVMAVLLCVIFVYGLVAVARRTFSDDTAKLLLWMTAGYLIVLELQGRLFVRYVVLILPYIAILIAVAFTEYFPREIPCRTTAAAATILVAVTSCASMTYCQVVSHSDFVLYRELGNYLRALQDDSRCRVFVDLEYPLKFHLRMWATPSADYGTIPAEEQKAQRTIFFNTMFRPRTGIPTALETGDIIVMSRMLWEPANLSFMHYLPIDSAPLEDAVRPLKTGSHERLPEQDRLEVYFRGHFELVRTFDYRGRRFASVYRVSPSYDRRQFAAFLQTAGGPPQEGFPRLVSFGPWIN